MERFRDTVMCGFGVICGAWAVFGAPYMGSTPALTTLVLTVAVIGIAIWDFRRAVKTGAGGSKEPPTQNAE